MRRPPRCFVPCPGHADPDRADPDRADPAAPPARARSRPNPRRCRPNRRRLLRQTPKPAAGAAAAGRFPKRAARTGCPIPETGGAPPTRARRNAGRIRPARERPRDGPDGWDDETVARGVHPQRRCAGNRSGLVFFIRGPKQYRKNGRFAVPKIDFFLPCPPRQNGREPGRRAGEVSARSAAASPPPALRSRRRTAARAPAADTGCTGPCVR